MTLTGTMDTSNNVATESGRIVLLPVQGTFRSPMMDYCKLIRIMPTTKFVYVRACNHPKKVKKKRVISIVVSENNTEPSSKISGTAPFILIGDATFVYVDRRKSDEYERAVHACRNEGSMCGSYRTNDGQVATAVRLGDKECRLKIIQQPESIVIVPEVVQE